MEDSIKMVPVAILSDLAQDPQLCFIHFRNFCSWCYRRVRVHPKVINSGTTAEVKWSLLLLIPVLLGVFLSE
jgi:hypothetical protein